MRKFIAIFLILFSAVAIAGGTYIKGPALIEGIESITASGGTSTLTKDSQTNVLVAGSSTHYIALPDATTLPNGRRFYITNRATDSLTVNDGASSVSTTILSGQQRSFILKDNSTAAGSWDISRILVDLANDVTDTLGISSGGTGATSLTANGVVVSNSGGTALSTVAPSTSGNVLTSNGTSWASTTPASAPDYSYQISNLGLTLSAASSTLTIALKDKDGNDPSGASPVKVGFRNSTATTGTYNVYSATSALSFDITTGATVGTSSGVTYNMYVYLIDSDGAGTLKLGFSMAKFSELSLQSTTAMSAAADSSSVLYSDGAYSSKPIRVIGRITISETTAGNWDTGPTEVVLAPMLYSLTDKVSLSMSNSTTSLSAASYTKVAFSSTHEDTKHCALSGGADGCTVPLDGIYLACGYALSPSVTWAVGESFKVAFYLAGAIYRDVDGSLADAAATHRMSAGGCVPIAATAGQKIDMYVYTDQAGSLPSGSSNAWFTVTKIGGD